MKKTKKTRTASKTRKAKATKKTMRRTADWQRRVRGLSRLHDGGHSSQERPRDQGRPRLSELHAGSAQHGHALDWIVTLIAHGSSPFGLAGATSQRIANAL
jgi:hypothetical protein